MNEGIRLLYEQILIKNKSIKTCIIGSYNLRGYYDMHHIYLDWENYQSSSVITLRNDRITVSMLNGEHKFDTYKFEK